MKVLVVSVGGSDVPVVTSVKKNNADYVYFVCSENDGQGNNGSWETVEGRITSPVHACKNCGAKSGGTMSTPLVEQTGLEAGTYEIIKVPCDKVYDVYEAVNKVIAKHIEKKDEVVVDYTGGTKSMAAGCVAAAMDYLECQMSLVTGQRVDLLKVRDGQEKFKKIRGVNKAFVHRRVELAQRLFAARDYEGSRVALEELVENDLADEKQDKWLDICRAFAEWDCFSWEQAAEKLKGYNAMPEVQPFFGQMGLVRNSLKWFENWKAGGRALHDYAPVYDLLLNAERRAAAKAYDDAMARVYRAVEMYAQFALKNCNPPINTSDVEVAALPESLQKRYETRRNAGGKVQLGLEADYDLLAELDHPVGKVWGTKENKGHRKKVLDMMKKRNYSFLAHGTEPFQEADWQDVRRVVWEFIEAADSQMDVRVPFAQTKQLPNDLRRFVFAE